MTKRQAIQDLMSLVIHFESQARPRSYNDKKTGESKTYTPSQDQVDFNTAQATKLNAVIDYLFGESQSSDNVPF